MATLVNVKKSLYDRSYSHTTIHGIDMWHKCILSNSFALGPPSQQQFATVAACII